MKSLKHRPTWIATGAAGVGLLVYLSLTTRPHHILTLSLGPYSLGDKIEHVLAFAVPMLWFGQILRSRPDRIVVAGFLIVLGAVLEWGQWEIGGYPEIEYGDIIASSLGVAAGWLLLNTRLARIIHFIDSCL